MINQTKNLPLAQETPYPLQAHFGFVLTDWKGDFCHLELYHEPFLMSSIMIPYCGIHAVLLDIVMGYAGFFTRDANAQNYTATMNLKVSFLIKSRGKIFFAE